MTWLITILSIIGVWLNIKKRPACFVIWTITNAAWFLVDLNAGLYAQAAVFLVYLGLSIYGFFTWERPST